MEKTEATMAVDQPSAPAVPGVNARVLRFRDFCAERGSMRLSEADLRKDIGVCISARAFSGVATCSLRDELHTAGEWLKYILRMRDADYTEAALHIVSGDIPLTDGDYSLCSVPTIERVAHAFAGVKLDIRLPERDPEK